MSQPPQNSYGQVPQVPQASYDQGAYGPQIPGGPQPSSGPGSGLALGAIITGGVALLGCWVPFLNIISILAGLVAVVLAVIVVVRARRGRATGTGLAWGGLAMGAVAVVVAILVDVLVGVSIARSSDDTGPALSAPSESADPDSPSAGPADALALGQTATVGDYTVAVTAVNPDADADIQRANQFNDPPTGRYVLAELSVTYNGTEEGNPWIDLNTEYLGTDARNYRSCSAVVPQSGLDVPTLRQGGSATYQVCFDVPADAIADGTVGVEDQMDFTGAEPEQYWSTGTAPAGT